MERSEAYGFSAAISGTFLLACLLFSALNREQRAPYMDEAFHVPQAQAYCEGLFQQWDPMITTLPGLYLMSVGIVKPAVWLFGWSGSVVCSTGMLRFINLLFSVGNFYLLYLLLCKIHHKNKKKRRRSLKWAGAAAAEIRSHFLKDKTNTQELRKKNIKEKKWSFC
ncbi:dol-P-Glc:Glc(2)Man(9)GlcNAc(2)-PP-Dol alpha-1,2-glucosyltransferase isoform X2 [Natator depressus]|uniref:dol-P-Glc:Glc(2)Man(9)GlcNAc(2)-PP-Dol alpha-1,2-glucosyltransferase isoform X2 n=1 Tax=Natator depressus TaxID=27790 RepID=UPI003EBF4EAE